MTSPIQVLIDAHNEYLRRLPSVTIEALPAYFAPIFDADPRVKAIVWGQWAPYFNDGEPCRFELHNEDMVRGTVEEDPNPYEDSEERDSLSAAGEWESYRALNAAAAGLLCALPRDLLERFCADGVIQVTRDSVQIFDYSHD